MSKVAEFFLNTGKEEETVVQAPAFSITKIIAVLAPLITLLVTQATEWIKNLSFTATHATALIVALVALLAVITSADVIARGIATSAERTATGRGKWIRFESPLKGMLALPVSQTNPTGKDENISVLAASDAQPPEYLCLREDGSLSWESAAIVTIG